MTDELNPTTPAQAIAAGLDVNPSTKLEYFLKHGGSGGGMPDASDYEDGTALIAKDGAFIPSAGYGYLAPDTIITWDGCYREGRDLIKAEGGYGYYFSPLQNVDIPAVDLTATAATEYDGESGSITATFAFSGESSTYKSWATSQSPGLMLYEVLSDSFWAMVGAESLGTGLFILMTAAADVEDGDCVVPNDEIVGDLVYFDSFVLTITLPGEIQQIDRKLIGNLVFTVNVEYDSSSNEDVCDKTAKEICEAFKIGPVQFIFSRSRSTFRANLISAKEPMRYTDDGYAFYVWQDNSATPSADDPGGVCVYTASTGDANPKRLQSSGSEPQ